MRNAYTSWTKLSSTHPVLKWSQTILFWLPTGIIFTKHGFTVRVVTGNSMQPTLNPDPSQPRDIVLFDRFSIESLRQYERGDIVALKSPHEHGKLLIKRIVALPGDTVRTLPPYPDKEVTLPNGYAWLEGDSSFESEDSNHFGPVPLALIDSRLVWIVWPWGRHGPLGTGKIGRRYSRSVEAAELERAARLRERV
ncbi:LexA/Signal peptidase [Auriscalpium vulgare]|uniref:LexA/Signal peptidase n=1 Tax=Auriscalpium vulgare TaxID=40419 RepID=A0ACB8RZD1_9AGAM|nr:LexA/Signal peptidase [Auriscalpium vulgare]